MNTSKNFLFSLLMVAFLLLPSHAVSTNEATTAQVYLKILGGTPANVALLNLFLTQMLKEENLHNHYFGSPYAETFLDWEEEEGHCIDLNEYKIVQACQSQSVPPNAQFFNTFSYFGDISLCCARQGLKILKERAVKETEFEQKIARTAPWVE